jgi:hypothetical protein
VLRAAQADVGTDAQLARLAQRLGPMLGPVAPAAPATTGLSAAAKAGLAGLALIVAGGGAWLVSASHPAGPPPAPIATHAVASPDVKPPVVSATPTPTPSPSEAIVGDATPLPTTASTPAKLPAKPTPPAQPSEAELLEQARAAMRADPARALQRANEHAARFPGGVLVQEREVLAIQALRKLGRSAEADRRAQAFAKAFPGSAFARKLNASP